MPVMGMTQPVHRGAAGASFLATQAASIAVGGGAAPVLGSDGYNTKAACIQSPPQDKKLRPNPHHCAQDTRTTGWLRVGGPDGCKWHWCVLEAANLSFYLDEACRSVQREITFDSSVQVAPVPTGTPPPVMAAAAMALAAGYPPPNLPSADSGFELEIQLSPALTPSNQKQVLHLKAASQVELHRWQQALEAAIPASIAAVEESPKARKPKRSHSFNELTKQLKDGSLTPPPYDLERLHFSSNLTVFNIGFYTQPDVQKNVQQYYDLCKESSGLHVTTSCFSVWHKNRKTNRYGKVIPAIPANTEPDGEATRVFFFDDNLEFDGLACSDGICNLCDVRTGDFVNFCEGSNGFRREPAARHTVLHHSDAYGNVLVKASILDAMADAQYFTRIIRQYTRPGEKAVVFMDVNSTIVCNDTVQGKDVRASLLTTLFDTIEFSPAQPFDLEWGGLAPVRVDRAQTLKKITSLLTPSRQDAQLFWSEGACWDLIAALQAQGDLRWAFREKSLRLEEVQMAFESYLHSATTQTTKDGITSSWFSAFEELRAGGHAVVLNSFGTDTWKVVLATVPDEQLVAQITISYDLWSERDQKKFESQFKRD